MRHFEDKPSPRRKPTLAALALIALAAMPLYRLAGANPSPPQEAGAKANAARGKLLYTVPQGPKNPFRYSVYRFAGQLWVEIEKDGKIQRIRWEDESKEADGWIRGNAKSLSFRFVDHEVRDALRSLLRQGGKSYLIDPRVQGNVTVSAQNLSLETSLANVLRQVGATYRIENGAYSIVPESVDKP